MTLLNKSFFETRNAKFIDDVGLSGSEHPREFVFEEEYENIPTTITTASDQVYLSNIIQFVNQENIDVTLQNSGISAERA